MQWCWIYHQSFFYHVCKHTPPNVLLMESNKRQLICSCNKYANLQRIHPNRTENVLQDKGTRPPTDAGRYVYLSVQAKKDGR